MRGNACCLGESVVNVPVSPVANRGTKRAHDAIAEEVLMLVPLLMTIGGLLISPAVWSARPIHCHQGIPSEFSWHEHAVLTAFDQSIQDYMDLHRRFARARSPLTVTADPAQLRDAMDSLGQAIRLARLSAQPGDIFTMAVARVLRCRIHRALWPVETPLL